MTVGLMKLHLYSSAETRSFFLRIYHFMQGFFSLYKFFLVNSFRALEQSVKLAQQSSENCATAIAKWPPCVSLVYTRLEMSLAVLHTYHGLGACCCFSICAYYWQLRVKLYTSDEVPLVQQWLTFGLPDVAGQNPQSSLTIWLEFMFNKPGGPEVSHPCSSPEVANLWSCRSCQSTTSIFPDHRSFWQGLMGVEVHPTTSGRPQVPHPCCSP